MDTMDLKILHSYRNKDNFYDIPVDEFQSYACKKFKYPLGALIAPITMHITDVNKDLNFFIENIKYLYDKIYTQEEQSVIAHYFFLFHYNKNDASNEFLYTLSPLFLIHSEKKEIQELIKILKYNYAELLILQRSPDQDSINQILMELEEDPPQFTLNDLLQFNED